MVYVSKYDKSEVVITDRKLYLKNNNKTVIVKKKKKKNLSGHENQCLSTYLFSEMGF